jgi:hypothetical protein
MSYEIEGSNLLATRTPIEGLALFVLCFAGCGASPPLRGNLQGEIQNAPQFKDVDDQELGQAANDPTASLMSLEILDAYTANLHGLSGEDANSVILRATVPFHTGSIKHIFGASTPLSTDNPVVGTGWSDTVLLDLLVFEGVRRRWGIGPVVLIPTGGSQPGAEQ